MLQQTTVPTVINYFNRFITRWPTLADLGSATLDEVFQEWQGLGYYSRAKNLKHTAEALSKVEFPKDHIALKQYLGIGEYTSKAIAAIAFNKAVVPIDGNIIRVFSRIFALETPLPKLKETIYQKTLEVGAGKHPGDFAQALMDLGSMICKPRNPKCSECPLQNVCKAYIKGIASNLPIRPTKAAKPIRLGRAYIHLRHDEILLERRPEKGLLANLWGVPTSNWDKDSLDLDKPIVTHVFTHFTLKLSIHASSEAISLSPNQKWVRFQDIKNYALPTLMKKVIKQVAQPDLE